ncbi:MAG: hypothetical protein J0I07_32210 [Myxococcales bacterium]|nr:hypothetical protein [Myxococcales bacterium]
MRLTKNALFVVNAVLSDAIVGVAKLYGSLFSPCQFTSVMLTTTGTEPGRKSTAPKWPGDGVTAATLPPDQVSASPVRMCCIAGICDSGSSLPPPAEYWPTAACAAESVLVTFWRTGTGQSAGVAGMIGGRPDDFLLPYGATG